MKVLVISHTYISPINRVKWTTLSRLFPATHITVVFPQIWPSNFGVVHATDIKNDNRENCEFLALEVMGAGNEVLYRYSSKALFRLIKKVRPDVVHVEQGAGAISYLQALIFSKIVCKNVRALFFTWINWKEKGSLKQLFFLRMLSWLNFMMSDGAIAGNEKAKLLLQEQGFKRKIMVLPQLGVDTDVFVPRPKGVLGSRKVIGFIWRLVEEKVVLLLVEAFAQFVDQFKDLDLLFIGAGLLEELLMRRVEQLGLGDRIKFQQATTHFGVAECFKSLDIAVLPSFDTPTWSEQFGHVLIEAMACGVPVVASTGGAIPEVVGDAGLLFKQNNMKSLLEQLQTFMQDESLRERYAERGLQRVQEHFSCPVIATKTYGFWQELRGNSLR